MPTVHLLIKGKVQGVFFRANAKEVAHQLGIKGWVKNTPADEVEATVAGDDAMVQRFIQWCRQGPQRAVVTDVVVTKKEDMTFNEFTIVRD